MLVVRVPDSYRGAPEGTLVLTSAHCRCSMMCGGGGGGARTQRKNAQGWFKTFRAQGVPGNPKP